MIKNLFGGKKSAKSNGDFFLELDETQTAKAKTEAVVETVVEKQPKAAVEAVSETQPEAAVGTVEEKKSEPAEAKTTKKSKKTSVKDKATSKAPKAPAPAPATTPAFISNNNKVEAKEVAFASKYGIDSNMSRRRPGPSLNAFKDMASKIQTR